MAAYATTFIKVRALGIAPSLVGFVAVACFRGHKVRPQERGEGQRPYDNDAGYTSHSEGGSLPSRPQLAHSVEAIVLYTLFCSST